MSTPLRLLVALCLLGLGCAQGHAADNKRLALIIANSQYKSTAVLKNPPNDARSIAEKLRELGFEVQVASDLDARGFALIIQEFSSKLDKNTDALFYYAGHGLEWDGQNYLVSVDAKLQSEATIQFETFQLNTVINLIERRASTALIFWDGCRTNPLATRLLATRMTLLTESSAAVRASAPIPPSPGDTMVVFSASPGNYAIDGPGDLSPFAEALLKNVATPNIEIRSMLTRVTADVQAKTKNAQKPQLLSQLSRDFYFKQQQDDQQLAYKKEIEDLKAKLALLQRQPTPEGHFAISGTAAGTKQQSPITEAAPSRPAEGSVSLAATGSQVLTKEVTPPASSSPPSAEQPASLPDAGIPAKHEASIAPPPTKNTSLDSSQSAPADQKPNLVVSVNAGQTTILRKLRIAPNGKLLAIGGDDGIVRIVDLDTFEVVQSIHAHDGRVSDLDFAPDNQTLLSAGRDGSLKFWDARTGQKKRPDLKAANSVPYTARLNPAFPDRYVLMGDKEGRLMAWDLSRDAKLVVNAKFHDGPVLSVAYQPGGSGTYLSTGADGLLKIRLPEGQRYTAKAHSGPIFSSGFNQNGSLIYTSGADRKIKIWDPAAGNLKEPLAELTGHLKYVLSAAISQDGKLLVSGGGDKAIDIWDMTSSHKLIGRLSGHTDDIEALAFTPNSRFIISASEDKTVRIWSVDSRKELVRMFFKADSGKFAGVTYDNKAFGDKDAGVMTIFVDGRAVAENKTEDALSYIGHGISIVDARR